MSALAHQHLLALSPPGAAFPRAADSVWGRTLRPLAAEHARLEEEAEALLREVDPGAAPRLLADYERVLGEDPCLGPAATLPLDMRYRVARQRWTQAGGATPQFFVDLAAALGVSVGIVESEPFEAGVSEAGDELIVERGRFEWVVRITAAALATEAGTPLALEASRAPLVMEGVPLIEFEAGVSEAGAPLGDFGALLAMECLIRRAAPAHTAVYFAYGS
jgi:uncharacterized protein YmfQ (DUF2313 family)